MGDGDPRGVLILGEAGYGKSTSTLACLARGWVTCGDDAVAAFPGEDGWTAHAIYAAVKTKLDGSEPPPARADVVTWTIHGAKRAHLLTATDAQLLVPRMHIDAAVSLNPHGDPTAPWRCLDGGQARNQVAPSTTASLVFDELTVLRRIGQLTQDILTVELPRRADLADTVADLEAIRVAGQPAGMRV